MTMKTKMSPMTKRQQKRADEIRAEVCRYIERLDAGEIPDAHPKISIGFARPEDATSPTDLSTLPAIDAPPEIADSETILRAIGRIREAQPSQQPSAEKGDRDDSNKS